MSGLKSGAWVNKAVLILVGLGLLVIVIAGMAVPDHKSDIHTWMADPGRDAVTLSSFYTAMLAAFWAYQGWVSVGFIGGEVKNARINIPMGITTGVIIVIVVYMAVNYIFLKLLTIPELEAINAAGNQIAATEAIRGIWGTQGVMFISVLILISTLGCTNATILTGARPYYAMARDGISSQG